MPDSVLGDTTSVNKVDKNSCPHGTYILVGGETQ